MKPQRKIIQVISLLTLVLCTSIAIATSDFMVKSITFKGLVRIKPASLMKYVPFKINHTVNNSQLDQLIHQLYNTGFFDNIKLYEHNNTLIIDTTERPTISKVTIKGNETIKSEKIQDALTAQHLTSGEIFNPATLKMMQQVITSIYKQNNFPNVNVSTKTTKQKRNRIMINLKINEGERINTGDIYFIGNHVFNNDTLLDNMTLPPTLWSFITHNDQYSENSLHKDMDQLQHFYQNHGYIDAVVSKNKLVFSKDKENVDIYLNIHEGKQYKVGKITIVQPKKFHLKLNHQALKTNDVYNRSLTNALAKSLQSKLNNQGYAFAIVNSSYTVNSKKRLVNLAFNVHPHQQVVVRRIEFSGNKITHDKVLRQEMMQFEGSTFNQRLINLSELRINQLGYLRNTKCTKTPVANRTDMVDLQCQTEEVPSMGLSASVGYSSQYGIIYNFKVNQKNFMGTGHALGINLEHNNMNSTIDLTYIDPYFFSGGISQALHLFFTHSTPDKYNIANYTSNNYGASLSYGFPSSTFEHTSLGLEFKHSNLNIGDNASQIIKDYETAHGDIYNETDVTLGWSHNSLNNSIFPTSGQKHNISLKVGVPIASHALKYYAISYMGTGYHPIGHQGFVAQWVTQLAYGQSYDKASTDTCLPFFKNYYAGGIGSIRGFEPYSMGPRDNKNNAIGGNILATASANLILPQWLSENVRFALFVDAGNVFESSIKTETIDVSTGIAMQWITPVAPIVLAIATPLKKQATDHPQNLAFSISTDL